MKRSMKVIVPILLALLILVSIVWYCFVYDREFTRDIMLQQARFFSTNGHNSVASWFYDLAYNYSGQDENVAIELANQFKAKGNYTKAEFTLSNAIADGSGTVEVYTALCKTYVEQNKLLDAVEMLDNIYNAEIRNALNALRPAAPTADPAPGYYTEYISVGLSSNGSTICYSTEGEYPSTDDAPYSEPITLPGGETSIYAISIADNGLVSPLSILNYTVGGVIEEVVLEDMAIDREIRSILGVSDDEVLYSDQLWTITSFTVPSDAAGYSDLSKLVYLESLTIQDQKIDSLGFLSSLVCLKSLNLSESRFSADELSVIAQVPTLQTLDLSHCGLSTLSGLEDAHSLTTLNLANNTIRNLAPLSGLTSLRSIDLQHNAVVKLDELIGLAQLSTLDLSYNSITSLSPLAGCDGLNWLNVSNNSLSSLSSVDKLTGLNYLNASHNSLTDVSAVSANTALTELYIAYNSITDISALSTLVNLRTFDFGNNQVTSLPNWPEGSAMRTIDGSYNQLTSLGPLKNLQDLSHVYMDYNGITSVAPLESCYHLVMVNIYGNAVTGVEKLTESGVIVNYDPTAAD